VVYCHQCPMLSKSVRDLAEVAAEHGLKLKATELKRARSSRRPILLRRLQSLVERPRAGGPLREQDPLQKYPAAEWIISAKRIAERLFLLGKRSLDLLTSM
jgi:hypothetical protein